VVPGAANLNGDWSPIANRDGVYSFVNNDWKSFTQNTDAALDSINSIVSVVVDPLDENHAFAGSWIDGLVEFRDDQVVAVHDENNSSLQSDAAWNGRVGIGGIAYDDDNNLWICNTSANEPISVLTSGGAWRSFGFNSNINRKLLYGG